MARRNILTKEQPALYKKCRPVTEFNPRLHQLLDDMAETLAGENGVGLAAPQVGVLRRAVIVLETNVPEGEEEYLIELVNPEIIEATGEQNGAEGCLSVPGFEVEGEGLTARCFCHEIDHLEGIVFTSKCERMLSEEELEKGEIKE